MTEAAPVLPANLILYFDGACEPVNPGGWATYGWIVCAEDAELLSGHGVAARPRTPGSTNNVAEYCALGFGLKALVDLGWTGSLAIHGDSMLVCKQLTQEWRCNVEHLVRLRQRCWAHLERLGNDYTVGWIPREQNERCDALTRQAYLEATGRPMPERKRKAKR